MNKITILDAVNSKDYLTEEINKFKGGRGHYTYIVKNRAYDIKECIEREDRISKLSIVNFTPEHMDAIAKAKEEVLPLCEDILKYRCFQESELYDIICYCTNKYTNANYYDFLKLVKMVNTWFDVTTEEKPANRIAWGWEKCREKDNPQAYLYGCIRNYLIRNGEFNKKEFNDIWFGRF